MGIWESGKFWQTSNQESFGEVFNNGLSSYVIQNRIQKIYIF